MTQLGNSFDFFTSARDSLTPDPEEFLNMPHAPVANMGGEAAVQRESSTMPGSNGELLPEDFERFDREQEQRDHNDSDYTPGGSKRAADSIEESHSKRTSLNEDSTLVSKLTAKNRKPALFANCKSEAKAQRQKLFEKISQVWGEDHT